MMQRQLTGAGVAATFVLALVALPAFAEDDERSLLRSDALGGHFTGTGAFTTEYFSRGKSTPRPGVPAVQPTLGFEHDSGAYLQVFGSNVDKAPPENSGTVEIDYTAGFKNEVGAFGYDLSGVYVTYPGSRHPEG